MVKCIDSESCDLDSSKSELWAECHSKLNVALSVMHECFEPLKESASCRNMVDDVIFSRWLKFVIIYRTLEFTFLLLIYSDPRCLCVLWKN
ncbi:hypothetical protein P8452_59833 [Trifolium repens]|nr:hypothetical protein P8452_59833 [Trifolium repens]